MTQRSLLDRILEPGAISVRFQPVYEFRPSVLVGHYIECLVRGPLGTSAENPEILFDYARKKNREAEVDRRCVLAVLDAAKILPKNSRIGINVHASTLARDAGFVDFLDEAAAQHSIDVDRLVVEIVEHAPPWDMRAFRYTLDALRERGAAIALDDVGLGHSNFLMILECRPSYFKIDRYFVSGSRTDIYRQAILTSIAQLASPFDARVVAEGVETEADLETVRRAGIDLVQGFLFGQPSERFNLAAAKHRIVA